MSISSPQSHLTPLLWCSQRLHPAQEDRKMILQVLFHVRSKLFIFCCPPLSVRRKCPFFFFLLNRSYLEFWRWTCVSAVFPLETSISPNNQLFCSYDYWALLEQLRRTWPCQLASGKRWSPRSKENVNIFFSQRKWGLSEQVCCENLKRKEFLCLEAITQRWQEWYNLKYIHCFHNVLLENLKESFPLENQSVYIQLSYTDELKCKYVQFM